MNTKEVVAQRRAFTLLELLVVVAIIGMLAALVLPLLGRARARGKDVSCLNNLKQWALATLMYADENDSRLPLEGNATGSESREGHAWYVDLPRTMKMPAYHELGFRTNHSRSTEKSVWLCPANRSTGSTSGKNLWHYAMNANVNGTGTGNAVVRLTMIPVPLKTVWMMDTAKQNPLLEPVRTDRNKLFPDLHRGKGENFAFLDGHVGFFPAREFLDEATGFVSTNDAHLSWRPLRPEFYR